MLLVGFKERYTRRIFQVVNISVERYSILRNGNTTWYWRINVLASLGMDVQRMSESLFILWVVLVSVLIRVLIFSAQFIPIISEDPSVEVVNFCRTPQWYIPRVSFLSFTCIFKWRCCALSGKYPLPYLDTMDICACPLRHALVSKLHHGKSWYSYWPHHCDRLTCVL